MLRHGFAILFLSCLSASVVGQACTNPGQLPSSSFPVCGATVFSQTVVPACSGSPIPTKCITAGVVYADKNPYWYKFTCYASGSLGFVITPNNLGDDYDWQLFNITGHQPADVYTDTSLFVSCNWSGDTALTGASVLGTSSINCAGAGVPTFNEMPMLSAGNTYLLMVSHFDNISQSGYALEFTGGSAGITDTTKSSIKSAVASCSGNSIVVTLNKKLKCSSLATDGSDFSLSATGVQIVQAVGTNCISGFDMDTIVLTLNNPLSAGPYTLSCKIGSDTNTLLDYCDAQMIAGTGITFAASPTPPATIDSILPLTCTPDKITLLFKTPVHCRSVAPDGSDFKITGPSQVFIDSAMVNCIGDTVKLITLRLTAPILTGGQYNISIQKGSDTNTQENVCFVYSGVGNSKSFFVADTVDAQITYNVIRTCKGDTVKFFANAGAGINSWNWVIDTFHAYIQNPVWLFTTSGNHVIHLSVTNGVCKDSMVSTIIINPIPPLNTSVTVRDVSCFGTKDGMLNAVSTGGLGSYNYQWVYGNTTISGNTVINADTGKYMLTVTDSVGCKATSTILVSQPFPLKHNSIKTNTNCGLTNGSAFVNISGGTLPYKYIWTPSGDTTVNATGLAAGNYVINIKDNNGCVDTVQISIGPSIGVNASIVKQSNSCLNNSSGSAVISSTGNGTIRYVWSPTGGNTYYANNLTNGNYTIVATDSLSCKDTVYVSIGLHPQITLNTHQKNVSCYNNKDGFIRLTANGPIPYTFQWYPIVSQSSAIAALDTGKYSVTVKDSFGCSINKQFTISQPNVLQLEVVSRNTTCGLNNGLAKALVTGGTKPYTYAWSYGYSTQQLTNLAPLTTNLAVTDSNGCNINHFGITIATSKSFTITLGNDIELCPGDSIRLSPGSFSSYSWQDGSALSVYTATHAGLYKVSVKNDSGCIATASVNILPVCQDLLFPDAFTPNNDKRNDAFGPLGTLQSVKGYSLKIFDRWGKLIFVSSDPYDKWNGKVNGVDVSNGSYVWIAEYTMYGKPKRVKKGVMVLFR